MAFPDPQSITLSGTARALPRINSGGAVGIFSNENEGLSLRVKQNVNERRFRREVRIQSDKTAAHPITGLTTAVSASIILTIDEPKFGFSDNELLALVDSIKIWMTDGNVSRVLGGEN